MLIMYLFVLNIEIITIQMMLSWLQNLEFRLLKEERLFKLNYQI